MRVFRRGSSPDRVDAPVEGEEHVDGLTGLPDRWQVEAWLSEQQSRSRRSGDRFGLFLISVSNLAEINSGYGSSVGDEVLQSLAETLTAAVGRRARVARYLGSEFAVVWPSLFSGDEVHAVAAELLASLPEQVAFQSFVVPLQLGVAGILSETGASERALMADVEQAMAEARMQTGNAVVVRDDVYGSPRTPDVLAVRLQRAFDADEFQIYYQPIVSLNSGSLVGFEGVLRWLAPDAGPTGAELITPGHFLDALRSSPIVVPLHAWVLRECAKNVSAWSKRLNSPSLFGATNLDPSFVVHERFVDVVMAAITEHGLRPTQLLFDINGEAVGPNAGALWPPLQRIKQSGAGIALEEFGIGYASPNLLRRCRFDVIRLPRSFVGGLGLAEEDRIIVQGLVRLAHDLGCYVIAEGVETAEQAELLREVGCDLGQGWLFGKPQSAPEVSRTLDELATAGRRLVPAKS